MSLSHLITEYGKSHFSAKSDLQFDLAFELLVKEQRLKNDLLELELEHKRLFFDRDKKQHIEMSKITN